MKRFKLFIENMLVYGLGGVISKIIPFIMLPIVTRLMPNTTYFGLSDLSTIIISFGQAIVIMGMYDGMFRMFFERDDHNFKESICSTAFYFVLRNAIIVFLIMIVLQRPLAKLFFDSSDYAGLLVLTAFSILIGSTNGIVSGPTRMQNKRKVFLVTNTLAPILSYAVSIPLLLKGHYIIALPLASAISSSTITIVFWILNRKWFKFKGRNAIHLKEMLAIAIPLIPNFLIYWIFNSSDRLMISKLIGIDWSGIYAVGARIGQISQLIYTAFAGGWQYFAFSTMKDEDQVDLNSRIFEYLGIITFIAGMIMATFSKQLFLILFDERYISAYIVMPYLFVAPLLLMLYQVICNQFIVIKKTWPNIVALGSGAIVNICLNLVLIPRIGIEGAALGTLMGYVVSIVIMLWMLLKDKLICLTKRFIFSVFCFVIFAILWRLTNLNNIILNILNTIIFTTLYFGLYIRDFKALLKNK